MTILSVLYWTRENKQDGLRSPLALNRDVSCQASCSCLLLTGRSEEQQKGRNFLGSSEFEHKQNKTNRLVDNAVGLKLNAQKCKVMRRNTRREDKVLIGRAEFEDVEEFVYLAATVTKEGGGTEDIKKRLSEAQGAFFNLRKICNTRRIGRNTKIKIFNTLLRPFLVYRCEAFDHIHMYFSQYKY